MFLGSDSDSGHTAMLDHLCPVGSKLELKLGAQVMLCKNTDVQRGLVNGARGVVEGFEANERGTSIWDQDNFQVNDSEDRPKYFLSSAFFVKCFPVGIRNWLDNFCL